MDAQKVKQEWAKMEIVQMNVNDIEPHPDNPRLNDDAVSELVKSMMRFKVTQPIVVNKHNQIIIGHTRWKAAKKIGLKTFPVIKRGDLDEAEEIALRIADNRTHEHAKWDLPKLKEQVLWLEKKDLTLDRKFLALDDFMAEQAEKEEKKAIKEQWDFEGTNEEFVCTVRGPLLDQPKVLKALKVLSTERNIKVEMSTISGRKKK